MSIDDADEILAIANHYIAHSTFYFSQTALDRNGIQDMISQRRALPGYVALYKSLIIGFGYAYPFRAESTFSQTVKLTYWLKEGFTGMKIGSRLYKILETDLRELNIANILVNVSSENIASLQFHKMLGFEECGNFLEVGFKNGRYFDVVWLQKSIR